MDELDLIKKLSKTGRDRVTLYLSESKVEQISVQTVSQATEMIRSENKGGKISGSILGFLGSEIAAQGGLEAKVAITPLLQAIAAEKAAEQTERLVDLAEQPPVEGKLIRYIGPAKFTTSSNQLTPDNASITADACKAVLQKKLIQEEIIRWKNKDASTVVLTFTNHDDVYAAIASTESLDVDLFASYHQQPLVGMLCRVEDAMNQEVTFLDPIWIWHETQ